MRHVEKVYSVKTNSLELCKYSLSNVTLESFKSWNWVEVDPSFFRWSLEKKHCKWQRSLSRGPGAGMFVIIFVEQIARLLLGKMFRQSLPVRNYRKFNAVLAELIC